MLTRDAAPPPMTLSTAIRLGAMLKAQANNGDTRSADGLRTCALGAALDAIGDGGCYTRVFNHFDIANTLAVQPVSKEPALMVLSIVRELNDHHKWTREQIADWVEGLEAAQAPAAPASVNAVRLSVEQPGVPLRV